MSGHFWGFSEYWSFIQLHRHILGPVYITFLSVYSRKAPNIHAIEWSYIKDPEDFLEKLPSVYGMTVTWYRFSPVTV